MALPSSGNPIDAVMIWEEYYKNVHTNQVVDISTMSILYNVAGTPIGYDDFYSKTVVLSYMFEAIRTVDTTNNKIDQVKVLNLGVISSTVDMTLGWNGIIDADGSDETDFDLWYSRDGTFTDSISLESRGTVGELVNFSGSQNIFNITQSESTSFKLRIEYVQTGSSSFGWCDVSINIIFDEPVGWILRLPTSTDTFESNFFIDPVIT